MIVYNNKQYSTLDDAIYFNGKKVIKAFFGNALVYPSTDIDIDEIIEDAGGDISPDLLFRASMFWNTKNPAADPVTGNGWANAGGDMDSYVTVFNLDLTDSSVTTATTISETGWNGASNGQIINGLLYQLDIDNTAGTAGPTGADGTVVEGSTNVGQKDPATGAVIRKGKYPVENHTITTKGNNTLISGYYVVYFTGFGNTTGDYFANIVWKVWDDPEKTQSHNVNKSYMYTGGDIAASHAVIVAILKIENGIVTEIIDKGDRIYNFIQSCTITVVDSVENKLTSALHKSTYTMDNKLTTLIYDVTQSDQEVEIIGEDNSN